MLNDQSELVKHGRVVFNIVCINITIMMVTDSVFSAIGPYFWMGDVFINNNLIGKLYAAATSLFKQRIGRDIEISQAAMWVFSLWLI